MLKQNNIVVLLFAVLLLMAFSITTYAANPWETYVDVIVDTKSDSVGYLADIQTNNSGLQVGAGGVFTISNTINSLSFNYLGLNVINEGILNIERDLVLTNKSENLENLGDYSSYNSEPQSMLRASGELNYNWSAVEKHSYINVNADLTLKGRFILNNIGVLSYYGGKIVFGDDTKLVIEDTTTKTEINEIINDNPWSISSYDAGIITANYFSDIQIGNDTSIKMNSQFSQAVYANFFSNIAFGNNTSIIYEFSQEESIVDLYQPAQIQVTYNSAVSFGDETEISIYAEQDDESLLFSQAFIIVKESSTLTLGEKTNITLNSIVRSAHYVPPYQSVPTNNIFFNLDDEASLEIGKNSKVAISGDYMTAFSAEAFPSPAELISLGDGFDLSLLGAYVNGIIVKSTIMKDSLTEVVIGKNTTISLNDINGIVPNDFDNIDKISHGLAAAEANITINDGLNLSTSGNFSEGISLSRSSGLHQKYKDYLSGEILYQDNYEGSKIDIFGAVTITTTGHNSSALLLKQAINIDNTKADSAGITANDKPFTITTSGDYSHGLVIDTFLKDEENELSLNNLVINVSGVKSNALRIITKDDRFLPHTEEDIAYAEENDYYLAPNVENMSFKFVNMSATSGSEGLLIFGATGTDIEITFENSTTLKGDILSTNFTQYVDPPADEAERVFSTDNIDILLTEGSIWEGSRVETSPYKDEIFYGYEPGTILNRVQIITPYSSVVNAIPYIFLGDSNAVNLYLHDTSEWWISKNSNVTLLEFEDNSAWVRFLYDDVDNIFHTAYVEELSGDGNFSMNVDVYSDDVNPSQGNGNHFTANKALGGVYSLDINSVNGKSGVEKLYLILIKEDGGYADFSLADANVKGEISIGSYKYTLESENDNTQTDWLRWYLKRGELDDKPKEEIRLAVFGLSEFAKAVDASLSDELLKYRNTIWISNFYKLQNFDSTYLEGGLNQHMGGSFVGINKSLSNTVDVGQFFSLNLGYQYIGEGSKAHISSLTTGSYLNFRLGGFSANAFVRAANYIHDFMFVNSTGKESNGTMKTLGISASIQASQKFSFLSGFFIEPKAKASYTFVDEQTYDLGGMELRNLKEKSWVTWLGARIGFDRSSFAVPYGYYLEAGWLHDNNPSTTVVIIDGDDEEPLNVTLGKNRFEAGLGFYSSPMSLSSLNVEIKYAIGEGITEFVKFQLGVSCYY